MLHAAKRWILAAVRLPGFDPLLPLSWTPPHTLGGAYGAAFFLLIRIITNVFCNQTSSNMNRLRQ
jgi:hypothetical protein